MFIFKSTGNYLGFIINDFFFSRDGVHLGWLEQGKFVWDTKGNFKGLLTGINNNFYILVNKLAIPPFSRAPKTAPNNPVIPPPPPNISPISLPVGYIDAF